MSLLSSKNTGFVMMLMIQALIKKATLRQLTQCLPKVYHGKDAGEKLVLPSPVIGDREASCLLTFPLLDTTGKEDLVDK